MRLSPFRLLEHTPNRPIGKPVFWLDEGKSFTAKSQRRKEKQIVFPLALASLR